MCSCRVDYCWCYDTKLGNNILPLTVCMRQLTSLKAASFFSQTWWWTPALRPDRFVSDTFDLRGCASWFIFPATLHINQIRDWFRGIFQYFPIKKYTPWRKRCWIGVIYAIAYSVRIGTKLTMGYSDTLWPMLTETWDNSLYSQSHQFYYRVTMTKLKRLKVAPWRKEMRLRI